MVVNDSEYYNTPEDFIKDILDMCKKRECLFDSITMARISANINLEEDDEEVPDKDWFENLKINPKPEEPDEILIPKKLVDEFIEYFDKLSFESKIKLLIYDTAEVLNSCIDFDEKGGNVLRRLIK